MLVTRRDQRVCPQLYNSHLPILYTFNFVLNKREQYGFQNNNRTQGFFPFYFFFLFCFVFAIFAFFLFDFALFFWFFKFKRCFFENGEEFRHDAVLDGHTLVKMLEESPFSLIKKVERVCDNKCVTYFVTGVIQRTCGKFRKQKDLLKKLLIAILLCCRLKLQF